MGQSKIKTWTQKSRNGRDRTIIMNRNRQRDMQKVRQRDRNRARKQRQQHVQPEGT